MNGSVKLEKWKADRLLDDGSNAQADTDLAERLVGACASVAATIAAQGLHGGQQTNWRPA